MNSFSFSDYDDEDELVQESLPQPVKEKKKPEAPKVSTFEFSDYDETTPEEEAPKEAKVHSWGDIISDVFKQGIKETAIGAGGTVGDLYQASKPNADLIDINPLQFAPTTDKLREVNEAAGGPGEAETGYGRAAGNIGKLYGSGLPFGQINPLPAIVGGLAGEGVKELGGGPLLQGAAEIASMILTPTKWPTLVNSARKAVQEKIANLMKLGYTEKEVTLAVNSASKGKKLGVKAHKGAKTEQAFEDFSQKSDQLVNDILSTEIAGYEEGSKHVHKLASNAYGEVLEQGKNVKIKDTEKFFNKMDKAVEDVRNIIGDGEEEVKFITKLTNDTLKVISNPTAETFINFYKRLNKMGKWVDRSTKDKIITEVKDSIKDTFRSSGKEGKALADNFEKVNAGVQKAYKAADVRKVIDKASTQEGLDYKKLYKAFDSPKNVKLFEEVLGPTQTKNLQLISKTAKEIKDFDKSWKAVSLLKETPVSFLTKGAYYMYSGSWPALIALKGAEVGGKLLAEKALTDPKFQNLLIRGMHAIKTESPRTFKVANEAMQKYLDDEGIDINLMTKD